MSSINPQNQKEDSSSYGPVGQHTLGGYRPEPAIPESDPTTEYRMNHCMLRIRDPEATLHFYTKLMGMRTIFAYNTGPITVYYLGYPQTAAHRADPAAFARETAPAMARTLGLLELCHYHGTEKHSEDIITTGTKAPHMGFGHLGFTVPDVKAATDRLREAGVNVIKEVGIEANEYTPVTDWDAQNLALSVQEIHDSFKNIVRQVAFVEDPNGYQIELVPQVFKHD